MPGAQWNGATLDGAFLNKISGRKLALIDTKLFRVKLMNADLEEARMGLAKFERCRMTALRSTGALAEGAEFMDCNLGGVEFSRARLRRASFIRCNMGGARFNNAQLEECYFRDCNLS